MIILSHGTNVEVFSRPLVFSLKLICVVCQTKHKKRTHPNNQNKGIYPIDLVQDPSEMNPFLLPNWNKVVH